MINTSWWVYGYGSKPCNPMLSTSWKITGVDKSPYGSVWKFDTMSTRKINNWMNKYVLNKYKYIYIIIIIIIYIYIYYAVKYKLYIYMYIYNLFTHIYIYIVHTSQTYKSGKLAGIVWMWYLFHLLPFLILSNVSECVVVCHGWPGRKGSNLEHLNALRRNLQAAREHVAGYVSGAGDSMRLILSSADQLHCQYRTVQTDEITRCILLHIPVNYTDYKDLTTTRLEWWLNMVK